MDWAVQALLAGWESASLNVLAGLEKPPNEFDVDRHVRRVFDDLGVKAPEMPHLATLYAIAIAQDMLAGAVTPHTGAKRLYRLWAATGYGKELQPWCGLDDQYELARDQVYGVVAEVEREILEQAARMVGSGALPPH